MQALFVETFGAHEAVRNAPPMQCQNAVTDERELDKIAGAHENATAAFGKVTYHCMYFLLRRNVDTLRRLVEQQYAHRARKPLRQDHFLLIAARQFRCRKMRLPRADIEELHQLLDQPIAFGSIDAAVTRQQLKARQQNVVSYRKIHDQAQPTLAGHKADANADGVRRRCDSMRHPVATYVDRLTAHAE